MRNGKLHNLEAFRPALEAGLVGILMQDLISR